jgi:hypothetical protein
MAETTNDLTPDEHDAWHRAHPTILTPAQHEAASKAIGFTSEQEEEEWHRPASDCSGCRTSRRESRPPPAPERNLSVLPRQNLSHGGTVPEKLPRGGLVHHDHVT